MRDLFPVHLNLDSNPTRGEVIVYRLAKQVCNLFMISVDGLRGLQAKLFDLQLSPPHHPEV